MEYNFREIEKKWQKRWVEEKTYQVTEDDSKQKFYVLNMFPYPSGAGLHVGNIPDTSRICTGFNDRIKSIICHNTFFFTQSHTF